MSTRLDIKRRELDLLRVEAARKELEFKVEERKEEIQRLEDHIVVQLKKEAEIQEELNKLKQQG
jgi:hypothetical protein